MQAGRKSEPAHANDARGRVLERTRSRLRLRPSDVLSLVTRIAARHSELLADLRAENAKAAADVLNNAGLEVSNESRDATRGTQRARADSG